MFMYSRIVVNSKENKELRGFDPYDILGIPKDTKDQDVMGER